MATQRIKLKRSAQADKVPAIADLELGEVAINTTDGKVYIKKKVGETESIVEVTGGEPNVQVDWNETNIESDAYIRNKPTIPVDTNTTYSVAASAVSGGANIDLTDSNSVVDSVKFSGSGSVIVSQVDANTIQISGTDTDTTYSNATTSTAGLMSSTDKSKLDNIAANAEVNVQANWNETNTASDAYILNKPTIPAAYSLPTATDTTLGGVKLGSATAQTTGANAVTTTSSRTYAIQNNSSGQLVVNVPWVDTNTIYSLPTATDTVLGGVKLASATQQTTGANAVTTNANRTYGIQVNASGQLVVNVPWVDTNTTYSNATTSVSGLMSSTDKSKLDNIASNANNYSLPAATSTVRGGIELFSDTVQSTGANAVTTNAGRTYGIQVNSSGQAVVNVPWVDTNTTYSNATTSASGLMSSTDKSKLNGIAANANNYSLPAATSTVRGGIELFSNTVQSTGANSVSNSAGRTYGIQVNSNGQAVVNVPWVDTNTTYSNATASASGLMSSTDKSKLDSLSYEEGSFTPQMIDVFGGVISTGTNGKYIKVGNTIQGRVTFNFSGTTYIYSNSAEYQIFGLPFWPTFNTTMPVGMGHKNFVQGNNPVGLLTVVSPAGNAELAVVNNTGATINMYPGISLFFNITNNN